MSTATGTQLPSNTKKVVKLPTQPKRAAFARREMRSQGKTVEDISAESGRAWQTVQRFMDVSPTLHPTKNPGTNTTVIIFRALGWDIAFVQKDARGRIEL